LTISTRLHCADGPAFVWLDDVREYYWHGKHVSGEWITRDRGMTAGVGRVPASAHRRRRAAGTSSAGIWNLSQLGTVSIDRVIRSDRPIGEVVAGASPGFRVTETIRARYLIAPVVRYGRTSAVRVPPDTQPARDAQAWLIRIGSDEFTLSVICFLTANSP